MNRLVSTLLRMAKAGDLEAASIEVTNRCNLRCRHCYRQQHGERDLSPEGWIKVFEELKKRHVVSMTYLGGEPLLRPRIIEIGRTYFPLNVVITNGTIPFPVWNDVIFGVSVDGTKGMHELVRGDYFHGMQYERIRSHVLQGVEKRLKIYALMTISHLNKHNIVDFIEEWQATGISGVILDFYTPMKNNRHDDHWIELKERDHVIDLLIKLRKRYGRFLPWNTPRMLSTMLSTNCGQHTQNCRRYSSKARLHFNSRGRSLHPCVMGRESETEADIDCDRCGCIVAFPFDFQFKLNSLRMVFF